MFDVTQIPSISLANEGKRRDPKQGRTPGEQILSSTDALISTSCPKTKTKGNRSGNPAVSRPLLSSKRRLASSWGASAVAAPGPFRRTAYRSVGAGNARGVSALVCTAGNKIDRFCQSSGSCQTPVSMSGITFTFATSIQRITGSRSGVWIAWALTDDDTLDRPSAYAGDEPLPAGSSPPRKLLVELASVRDFSAALTPTIAELNPFRTFLGALAPSTTTRDWSARVWRDS